MRARADDTFNQNVTTTLHFALFADFKPNSMMLVVVYIAHNTLEQNHSLSSWRDIVGCAFTLLVRSAGRQITLAKKKTQYTQYLQ